MKKLTLLVLASLFSILNIIGQDIEPAPKDKSVVYFVRYSSLGFAINFTYFDSTQVIGKFGGANYYRYECEPGKHLFWARSENKSFLEAYLLPGKIYFIEVAPQMGGIKAGVQLYARGSNHQDAFEKMLKFMSKKDPSTYAKERMELMTKQSVGIITRGMKKYKKMKQSGQRIKQLDSLMFFQENVQTYN